MWLSVSFLLRGGIEEMKVSVAQSCLPLVAPWTVACQAPLSTGFSRPEYCSGLLLASPEDLPDLGIEPRSPALQADSSPCGPPEVELLGHKV